MYKYIVVFFKKLLAASKVRVRGWYGEAWVLADGTVVTWGNPIGGGKSSSVQDQLRNVQQISGANSAFAAISADGTIVTCGLPNSGGDSSEVQDQFMYI